MGGVTGGVSGLVYDMKEAAVARNLSITGRGSVHNGSRGVRLGTERGSAPEGEEEEEEEEEADET